MEKPNSNLDVQTEVLARAIASALGKDKTLETMSEAEKRNLLMSIASSDDARKEYIRSRASVILPLIDVQSTVRSIFTPETLAPNAQSSYPISFDYTEVASYMPKFGGIATHVLEGDELYIPTWGIDAEVEWSMDIAEQGRVNIAENATNLLKNRIIAKEERAGWQTIKTTLTGIAGVNGFNSSQVVYCSGGVQAYNYFSKKAVNDMSVQMDLQRRHLSDLYVSPRSYGDIRGWQQNSIDYLTQREIFVNGGLPDGRIYDIQLHKVYDNQIIADDEAYGFDVRTYGKMPIKKELITVENPVSILQWRVGIMAREIVGFGVTDSWAVVKGKMLSAHIGPDAC